jgi:malonyl-CoA O-methyltransferase
MYSKKTVSGSFSRFSKVYDEYAEAQAEAAFRLVSFIKKNIDKLPEGPVLEIGCGTGFVTREILPLYPDRKFLITDISQGMCETCRDHLVNLGADSSRIIFAVYDGESSWPENMFSFIFSGFTIQWFSDLEKSLSILASSIKPGGVFAFSFQADGSFTEWKNACRKLDIPFTANPLPSLDSVLEILSMPEYKLDVSHSECSIPVSYPSSADFFRALKRIGAGTMSSGEHLSPAMMKGLMKELDSTHDSVLTVTYRAAFFFCQKR